MTKWIQDWTDDQGSHSIIANEVHTTHIEAHNTLSGNPEFRVRLEIPWTSLTLALQRLLGKPERWPLPHPFYSTRYAAAIAAQVLNDQGRYSTDGDMQVINYEHNALVDVIYMVRLGVYTRLKGTIAFTDIDEDVYIEDNEEPRIEIFTNEPKLFIWGNTADTVPTIPGIPVSGQEMPTKFETGQTLIHTIEGWNGKSAATNPVNSVGKVHSVDYTAPTGRFYPANTLMLRNYNVIRSFSFRSYRAAKTPTRPTDFYDPSGFPTQTLRMVYEYKPNGWERFYRADLAAKQTGYYYIRYAESPHTKFVPFASEDQSIYFMNDITQFAQGV